MTYTDYVKFRVTSEQKNKLREMAKEKGVDVSDVLRMILAEYRSLDEKLENALTKALVEAHKINTRPPGLNDISIGNPPNLEMPRNE